MEARLSRLPASAYWLIAANVLPLAGVVLFGWSTFAIVMIYWCENVIIGLVNVLKIACCQPDAAEIERVLLSQEDDSKIDEKLRQFKELSKPSGLMHQASKAFAIPFFIFHYGMFCMVHGMFIVSLLGDEGTRGLMGSPLTIYSGLFARAGAAGLGWAIAGLAVSHLYSFFTNYIGKGEYRRTVVPLLMMQPYARVVVLHIAILFGAFATVALGSPIFVLVLLVIGKTALDLMLHLKEREKFEPDLAVLRD